MEVPSAWLAIRYHDGFLAGLTIGVGIGLLLAAVVVWLLTRGMPMQTGCRR